MKKLPSLYQEFIHLSRYSRWLESEKRRETWEETVSRYFLFFETHLKENNNYTISKQLRTELQEAILNLEIMPSMRSLMTAGEALSRDNTAGYNCAYVIVNRVRAFDEILYTLMCGTGVGYSVERQYVEKLPTIAEEFTNSDTTIVVQDSKAGWAKAFKELVSLLIGGQMPKWDLSKIRPSGARLKTFGGRASGPEPLDELFRFTTESFKKAAGRKLTSIECHDLICKVAEVVVVGGVRRSALISLSDLNDERMRNAKSGAWWNDNPQRALANNSVAYKEKPEIGTFIEEWLSLYKSKSGERGIFNRQAAKKTIERLGDRRDPSYEMGCNPCSEILLRDREFCVSGNTQIITNSGIIPICDLVDKEVTIWNGKEWSNVTPRITGFNQKLVRVTFSDGSYLDCTPDHRFSVRNRFDKKYKTIEAKDLMNSSNYVLHIEPHNIKPIEEGLPLDKAYTMGFAFGDGCVYRNKIIIDLYGIKDMSCPVEGKRYPKKLKKNYNVESQRVIAKGNVQLLTSLKNEEDYLSHLSTYDRKSILEFFAGWIDADGSNTKTPNSIRLYISGEQRARLAQLVLTRCGIVSSVNLLQKKGAKTNISIRKNDLWYLQIQNCADIPCKRVNTSHTILAKYKGKHQNIKSVIDLPERHTSYCFDEPIRHMGLFANVLTYQCNLTEVVIRPEDNEETLSRKIKLATILGTWQASLTYFPYLSSEWKKNCDEEALLGVSLTGVVDNKLTSTTGSELNTLLERLKQVAIDTNKEWAKRIHINAAAAITCNKPSGTVSALVDCASGIHARHNHYYIRTVRADRKDPLCKMMMELEFPHEACVAKPDSTVVFSFPMKAENSITRNDMSAIQQLELWLTYQRHWTEHKPSVTITVREHEWLDVGAWVYNHFDEISGISFLPFSDHSYKQAPYQDCTKEQYESLLEKMPKEIDWSVLQIYEHEDNTIGNQSFACSGDKCELVDLT